MVDMHNRVYYGEIFTVKDSGSQAHAGASTANNLILMINHE